MTPATPRDSTQPLSTPISGLSDAALALDALAAGTQPDRARLIAGALALDTLIKTTSASRDLLDAAAGLQILATGGTLDLDEAGRLRARQFAEAVRQLIVAPDAGRGLDLGRPDRPVALRGRAAARSWCARIADRGPLRRALERGLRHILRECCGKTARDTGSA
jgi:hypothetical protein